MKKDLDYYKLYLQNYLREHSFDESLLESAIVQDNADMAAQTFEDWRRAGADVFGANEAAINDLFTNIGASRYETASDYLESWFSDVEILKDHDVFEEWCHKVAALDFWKEYEIEGGLGLNEELVETHLNEIIGEIVQFLEDNGL